MSDNVISTIISSIYSKIINFFIFIFLIFTIGAFSLFHGIRIEKIDTSFMQLEQLYIKWNEKLIISVKKIRILPFQKQAASAHPDLTQIPQILLNVYSLFERIDVPSVTYKNVTASILYDPRKNGYVTVDTGTFRLNGDIAIDDSQITLKIKELRYDSLAFFADGVVTYDKRNDGVEARFACNIANEAYFDVFANYADDVVTYRGVFPQPIRDFKRLLRIFRLPKNVRYWAMDAITTDAVDIQKLEGSFRISKPKTFLKNLHVVAVCDRLTYTYHRDIDPVYTKYTLLEFRQGVLYIRPFEPREYGFDLERSYLTIDFASPQEVLTLYLRFQNGKLDHNILHILSTYGIVVPLRQNSGATQTDLRLRVNLRTLDVTAKGTFRVEKGNFHYLGMDIDVKNVVVTIENSHITARRFLASYDSTLEAAVDLDLYLAQKSGTIDLAFSKIELPAYRLSLQKPLAVRYTVQKSGIDLILVPQSRWTWQNTTLDIDPLRIPFRFVDLSLTLPITRVDIKDNVSAFISGEASLRRKRFDIDIDVVKLLFNRFQSAQSNIYLKLLRDENATQIFTDKETRFFVADKEMILKPFSVESKNGIVETSQIDLTFKNDLHSTFSLRFDTEKNNAIMRLSSLAIAYSPFEDIVDIQTKEPIKCKISYNDKRIKISSRRLATYIKWEFDKGVSFGITALKKLVPYSKILRRFEIRDGKVVADATRIHSVFTSGFVLFDTEQKLQKYTVNADLAGATPLVTINDTFHIRLSDTMKINADKSIINVSEFERFLEALQNLKTSSQNDDDEYALYAKLTDGAFYISQDRQIPYDSFKLQNTKNETTAQLRHAKGKAGFQYDGKTFYLYGSNFNDEFMNDLFFQSKFKGGKLDFNLVGRFKDFKGIIEITKTTILDYKVLNNILAFIDTIPSLVTFSLPKYSKEGLFVHQAYASFHYKNSVFTFDNISIDSDQFDIVGKGKASYLYDFIDLILQLKTNFADKASKVPIAGYILFDGKTLSTTLKVKGKLEDPKVSTMLAKDIAVAPLNIIKRTILLPIHLLGLDK